MFVQFTREQWRTVEGLSAALPESSAFFRDTARAHGAFVGVSRDGAKSRARIDASDARLILSAARSALAELAKRPRYLENPRFVALRNVACILSAALDMSGFVSDCH